MGDAIGVAAEKELIFAGPLGSEVVEHCLRVRIIAVVRFVAIVCAAEGEAHGYAGLVEEFAGLDHGGEAEGGRRNLVLVVVGHGELFADPFGEEVGHMVVAGDHLLGYGLFKVAAVVFQLPVDGLGAGVDEAVEIGTFGADAFEQIERAHGVDVKVLAVVEGAAEGCGDVVDGVNAFDGIADVLQVAQVAGHGFDVGVGIQLMCAADVARIDE